ncbi:glycosyltransferase family 39 protein [Candidatus Bathyarchaeota archaeon]|nr:glycosyltransferase family 39 protein [Candidatus Bathyarchaeota archaeon]
MTTEQTSRVHGTLKRLAKASSAGLRRTLASKTNKLRLILLVFTVVYAAFLLLDLGYMTLQWDEMPHMNGGLLLAGGQTDRYLTIYGYYPPIYDIVTTGCFQLFGVGAASGRLAAVAFSLFAIWIVFEFANRAYEPRTALLSSVLLGTMPGFFWLSRVAMLETMLIFFFSFTLFFFFTWLSNEKDRTLIITGLALGVGFLAKYQVLVAGLVMIVGLLLVGRKKLKWKFARFLVIPLIAGLVVAPWLIVLFQAGGFNNFGKVLYTISGGHEERLDYSARFPLPVFYLIEMTWPYNDIPVHPVSLPIYILGLLGLGLYAWRRKPADKFFLVWFAVTYVFFTLLTNKQWRYITPIFPVLAISAASFIFFVYEKIRVVWKSVQSNLKKRRINQIAGVLFMVLIASGIIYSGYESYQMTARDQIHIPIEETANYVASHMNQNESAVIVCAFNLLNQEMFWFYLPENVSQDQIWQYPELAVDSFTPQFNITEFVSLCEQRNVKYAILYDYGAESPFYNTTLTYSNVTTLLFESGRFGGTGDEPFFGEMPYRTFLAGFHEPYA